MSYTYKLHKCTQGQEGAYQILELKDDLWITCGVYFKKTDAIKDLKILTNKRESKKCTA